MSDLTPTQSLIGDVLAARLRTGENLWTFDSRLYKQADALRELGLVGMKHGIVEKTFQAWLTNKGQLRFVSEEYVTPNDIALNRTRKAGRDEERARIAYGLGCCQVIPREFTLHAMEIVNGGCTCQKARPTRGPRPSS